MKKFFGNIVEVTAATLVVALAIIVFLQVFNRFVLKTPLAWSEDLAMLLFQWVSFLGAAIGVKRWRHFGIELVVKMLPEKMRRRVELLVPIIVGMVALVMITEGIEVLSFNRNRFYSSMGLSYIWPYLAIPVSGCLMIFYLIVQEIHRWKKKEGGSAQS
ncbi:MAG: TRAP transporter small permease [Desulfobacterales bacterium]|nr:TRAP transporter small permease [Desulfobacterales bacterium]